MLSKKAIAAFAAGATLVSGLALTVPALAEGPQQGGSSTQVDNSVKELDNVSFKFVNGTKSVTTRAVKVYTKDGKYGFSKVAITSSAAQLTEAFLAEVKDNDAVKDAKGVTYPATINAGVNTVPVTVDQKAVASNTTEQTPEALQHQAEQQAKQQPDATQNDIAELAMKARNEGLGRKVVADILKAKNIESANEIYYQAKTEAAYTKESTKAAIEAIAKKAEAKKLNKLADLIRKTAKTAAEAQAMLDMGEGTDSTSHDTTDHDSEVRMTIELIAQQAEKEGLKDAAVKIRAAKTVEEANKLLTAAETPKSIEALAQKAEHKGLKDVVAKIRAAKTVKAAQDLLAKAEQAAIKALAKKADKQYFAKYIVDRIDKAKTIEGARAFYAEVMNARGDMPAPVVDDPSESVTVAPDEEEPEESNQFIADDPELQFSPFYKTEDPDVMVKRILKQDAIEKIAKQAEKEGFTFAAKQIRKAKTVEGAQALLDAARASKKTPEPKPVPPTPETKFDIEHALSQVNGDTVADYKLHPADVSELVGGKGQTPVVPTPAVDPAIEALAKKAESEGLTFAAKYIRKAKTVEGARALLAEAEKSAIEDLAKKAEKEGFTFVAKLIRKAKTVEGARALLAEAEKGKKPTPTPVPPTPKPTPTPTPTPVPPAPKPTPTPTPTPVPPAPVPTPEPKIEHKLDLVDLLGGKDAKEPTFVSPDGSENLFTNYDGLTVLLAKHGLTNVAAYDALLDKLEFGLKQTGWANILKNFGGDNCAYLGKLRNQLKKAVAHYGHVEAAVKDILKELKDDYKDAQKAEDWDAAKVIKSKLAAASKLAEVAHHNRTRAAAILDSANDHAKDLSCDTGAQEVLDAMKKAGNFPGKAAAKAPAKKHAAAAAAPLAKTGAAVALAAVAASVLAGMGAALRKIRH